MQKIIIGVGVLVVVIVIGVFLVSTRYNDDKVEPQPTVSTTGTPVSSPVITATNQPTPSTSPIVQVQAKIFTVVAGNFSFSPSQIKVNKGDTVKIIFQNKEGFHDWAIDEFKAKTNKITAGLTETIEFVADKAGQFEYYCSVGDHRARGMKGLLIVE